ncbi:hypothetical protein QQG09_08085 [Melissococcus plutonius]|uniref:Uncharacterized protein n=1 Tax=Melissococcus plutonius TaxID=33970 RepID=A0A2Z5Y1A9_9ENTE|nr:hypothetical protein [Melissococcus plutonius]BAL61804.1 hypothetical protein MPD5_0535 [Melissococcus plutonius DAT561]MCV2498251.1 hypothetical protein [Melissococcus plutonius]MCV2501670.1 hypothetical protein [Melissococcus plutonius]MCV2504638.1 hypothetical protein [Melissococcus plutonius]MCV2506866.1 hypothetical protein [Melissococcus plutonius]
MRSRLQSIHSIKALENLLPKQRPMQRGEFKIGELYVCDVTLRSDEWQYPFIGEVTYINEKSTIVTIIDVYLADKVLARRLNWVTVVPFKCMQPLTNH